MSNSEKFKKAFNKVSEASKKMRKSLSSGEVWTSKDMDHYLEMKERFEEANEEFKDAAEEEFGNRPHVSGFE